MTEQYTTVLGIRFLDADVTVAIDRLERGGLMVVPSGPGLATLDSAPLYREAVVHADFALVDSAYLAILWFALTRHRLHRVSGLAFLRAFLARDEGRAAGALFLVNPSDSDGAANVRWLNERGFSIREHDCYTAPRYVHDDIVDPRLVEILERRRPKYVMLNIGGGTQEPLGYYLRRSLSYVPGIMCTGAAIAFLTGRQAHIPVWADSLGLGWLARSLQNPRVFVPRYVNAMKLARVVTEWRDAAPAP